jgi:hypothetical protein
MARAFLAARRLRVPGLVLLALIGAACQSSYYDEYRADHPEWDAEFPREGASLEQVLAGLYAPATQDGTRISVDTVEIWRVDSSGATRIEFDGVRRGEVGLEPQADLVVIALRTCQSERGLESLSTTRAGYYVLPELRLAAYDHYVFGRLCAAENQFLAARGDALQLEQVATARIATHYGRVPLDLSQLYRRGLAYLEAGRVLDAEAVLTRGEPGFVDLETRARRGEGDAQAFQETARLRMQLMRALGVETRKAAPAH